MTVPTASCDASATLGARVKERRRSRRYSCSGFAEVMVTHPDCLFRGEIRDISLHGCFVIFRAFVRFERLAEAEIHFKLNNCQFRIRARVISARQGDGVGFEFAGLNPQTQGLLSNLMQELSQTHG